MKSFKQSIGFIRNENIQEVRISNRKINCIRFSNQETWEHLMTKARICQELQRKGHYYVTEAIFNNGARADILDLDEGVVYEVLKTETEEECKKKKEYYPEHFIIKMVRC